MKSSMDWDASGVSSHGTVSQLTGSGRGQARVELWSAQR